MTRPRALGYVRVSTAREDMISPDLQERAIRDYCDRAGYRLVDVAADLDQSGRSFARAEVQRVIERIEAREAEVVVVWKVSRFGRTRRDWYIHADRLEVAGGRLESATEGFDAATSVGKFTRGMLVELAAFESDRIGDVWREVQARRVKEGLTHNGRPRFGYYYSRDAGYIPDPVTRDAVAHCFERYLAGEGFYSIARWLNTHGHRTTQGGLWTDTTLRRMLDSGFPAGWITYHGDRIRGAHEPIVDAATWDAYEAARGERRRIPARRKSSPYLLSGLIRCGWCGASMNAGEFGTGRTPKYRCEKRRSTAGVGCQGGYVSAARVHEAVFDALVTLADDLDEAATVAAQERAQARVSTGVDVDRLAREAARMETALVKLAQSHVEGDVDDDTYRAARADYTRRRDEAREAHEQARLTAERLAAPQASIAARLVDDWHTLGVSARREMLRALYARVDVWTYGRGTPPVVECVPLGHP